jgi:hypothetical protein
MNHLEKAIFLSKAKPLNLRLELQESKPLNDLILSLLIDFKRDLKFKRFHKTKYIQLLKKLIANALSSNLFTLDLSNRHKNTITLKKLILFMIKKEFIVIYKGFKNTNKSKKTRILFTPKFKDLIHLYNISSNNIILENNNLILLKNENKDIVGYNKSNKTIMLEEYNSLYKKNILSIIDEIVPYSPLYRIFNNSKYSLGGRFYGSYVQTITKQKRSQLLINGRSTCELDFPCLHMSILYSFKNQELKYDAYYLKEYPEERSLIKFITLILMFTKSIDQAVKVILFKKFKNNAFYSNKINHIIFLLLEKHSLIKDLFFKPKLCLRLQNIESRIASLILKHFTKKQILILPIHDGFICEKKYHDELKEIMKKSFQKQTKMEIDF